MRSSLPRTFSASHKQYSIFEGMELAILLDPLLDGLVDFLFFLTTLTMLVKGVDHCISEVSFLLSLLLLR